MGFAMTQFSYGKMEAAQLEGKRSDPDGADGAIRYPGEQIVHTRRENLKNGIPVNRKVWEEITLL
jgi:LDH2 family malate/lactate/ureidoglycolate dehydrogenase